MAITKPTKNLEKFVLRLPDGMRDRIKTQADRAGMSMNEAIIWVLERHFPAPRTLDEKLDELATIAAILKTGGDPEASVDRLIGQLHETVDEIVKGKLPAPVDFKQRVKDQLERWQDEAAEAAHYDTVSPFEGLPDPAVATDRHSTDDDEPFGEPI
ncbi:MAG TPA: Arc family DNA-binding protein [Kaistia sp.]|jgi:predicted Rdx family selenoprotein|nr:Arc family DNA-binding protein [Kaistia sp.]